MKKQSILDRLRAKKQPQSIELGIAWYTEECWEKVKLNSSDPDRFEATYAEWLVMANSAFASMVKNGVNAKKFLINVDELLAWCLVQNRENNSDSRAGFVVEKLQEKNVSNTRV
jgi:hypothetical protein